MLSEQSQSEDFFNLTNSFSESDVFYWECMFIMYILIRVDNLLSTSYIFNVCQFLVDNM